MLTSLKYKQFIFFNDENINLKIVFGLFNDKLNTFLFTVEGKIKNQLDNEETCCSHSGLLFLLNNKASFTCTTAHITTFGALIGTGNS